MQDTEISSRKGISPKKRPTQARAVERVEKICQATVQLLAEGGPDAVTTTAIARLAKIPVGSVYQYFDGRDDLLQQLYNVAYAEVTGGVTALIATMSQGISYQDANRQLFETFWQAARSHKTFRPLTRWANQRASLWEVTPGPNSGLDDMVDAVLTLTGIELDPARRPAIMKTAVTAISVLVDQAIEEEDEQFAVQLIDEIGTLAGVYLDTNKR